MANLQGYTMGAITNMLNHYTRHDGDEHQENYTYGNQKIDTGKTYQNYSLFEREDPYSFINSRISEADTKPSKNTNVISDWIVTLPKNEKLTGREREFFQSVHEFLCNKVGKENVVGSWVHMDETSPHVHFCFVPLCERAKMTNDKSQPLRWTEADEKKNANHKAGEVKRDSKGTVRYKRVVATDENGDPLTSKTISQTKVFDRAAMQQFHPELTEHLRKQFGFNVGVELEDAGDKILSKLEHQDYIEAKTTLKKTQEEVERLTDKREEIRKQTTSELSGLQEIRTRRKATQGRVDVLAALSAKQRATDTSRLSEKGSRLNEIIATCVKLMEQLGVDKKTLARFAVGTVIMGIDSTRRRPVNRMGREAGKRVATMMLQVGANQPQKELHI